MRKTLPPEVAAAFDIDCEYIQGSSGDQPADMQAPEVESRIERALLYLQNLFRYLLYALSDGPSVLRLGGEGAEDEKVECALNEIVGLAHAQIIYNYSVDSPGVI